MPPAARITDMHTCPMVTGVVPHVGGSILPPGCPMVEESTNQPPWATSQSVHMVRTAHDVASVRRSNHVVTIHLPIISAAGPF